MFTVLWLIVPGTAGVVFLHIASIELQLAYACNQIRLEAKRIFIATMGYAVILISIIFAVYNIYIQG